MMSDWTTSETLWWAHYNQSPRPRTCQVKSGIKFGSIFFIFCWFSDCVSKALNSSSGGGRYSCDECGKLFKHPGSLQHHRHIHRGTHKCPSCGKVTQWISGPPKISPKIFQAFSRRWDMERHLNKSKYGCPANRFSSTGQPLNEMGEPLSGSDMGHEPVSLVSIPHEANLVTLIPNNMNGAAP